MLSTVHSNLRSLNPDFCGYGVFGLKGKDGPKDGFHGGGYGMGTWDSRSGTSVGTLFEVGYGPYSVGKETSVNVSSGQVENTTLLMYGAGDHAGAFVGYTDSNSPIQIGGYVFGKNRGGGAYVNIVPSNGCHD